MRKSRIHITLESVTLKHPSISQQIQAATTAKRPRKPAVPTTTLIVNTPPILFTAQQKEDTHAAGLRMIQLHFPMQRSINRQYKITGKLSGRRMYTDPQYKTEKDTAREAIEKQVKEAGWITQKDDRYLAVFDLCYSSDVKQDLDGPVKATTDILQRQTPSKTVKKEENLFNEEMVEVWKESHPYAIWNDGNIMQSLLIKHTSQKDLTCTVTIYAFERQQFPIIPVHLFVFQFLVNHSRTEGHLHHGFNP